MVREEVERRRSVAVLLITEGDSLVTIFCNAVVLWSSRQRRSLSSRLRHENRNSSAGLVFFSSIGSLGNRVLIVYGPQNNVQLSKLPNVFDIERLKFLMMVRVIHFLFSLSHERLVLDRFFKSRNTLLIVAPTVGKKNISSGFLRQRNVLRERRKE